MFVCPQCGESAEDAGVCTKHECALEVSEDLQTQAVERLSVAERAIDPAAVQTALMEASDVQTQALSRLEDLLDKLSEWDNFQNILALTRDIRNRQKALRERTQQFMSEK